jgi:hypothetical protein
MQEGIPEGSVQPAGSKVRKGGFAINLDDKARNEGEL